MAIFNHESNSNCFIFSILNITLWIMPDLCVLITAVIIFFLVRKMATDRKKEQPQTLHSIKITKQEKSEKSQKINEFDRHRIQLIKFVGNVSTLAALCISGAISSSLLNLIYFTLFLGSSTYLAFNQNLRKKFAIILKIVSFIIFIQILCITGFQNPWIYSNKIFQTSFNARILGFMRIIIIDNDQHFSHFKINHKLSLDKLLHPFILMMTYFVITHYASYIMVTFKYFAVKIYKIFNFFFRKTKK